MKKILFVLLCVFSLSINAETKNDTISINQTDVSEWVVDKTENTKGKTTIKYYAIYKGELVNTSKSVYDKVMLCLKYRAKCSLALVKTKTNKKIVLN